MASNWEEVKRLAADFQRTQLSQTLLRLSDRNCVEIVKRLIDMKLLDVIFTCDGKEYLTHEHLIKEIEDELYVSGGRISLSDLVSILNVDYVHCEAKASQIARTSAGDVSLVLGQLVSRQYKDALAQEVDLKLQESGIITIAELTKLYDLPADFIENIIVERLGTIIKGKTDATDSRVIMTDDYLSRYQSKIIGVLSAVTRPVSVSSLINRYKFPERIFNNMMSDLISTGRLCGTLSGRTYIPDIYAKTQLEYVENFYKQNGYLDYSTLSRLGIANAQTFLQKRFGDELCYLDSCAVGQMLMFQVESSIEEAVLNNTWVDLMPVMPTILGETDVNILISKTLEQNKNLSDPTIVLCDTVVVSKSFIEKCQESFGPIIAKKVDEDLKSGLLLSRYASQQISKFDVTEDKRSDDKSRSSKTQSRTVKKSGTGGAGSQGREVKNKAVKKKYRTSKQTVHDESDDETPSDEFFLSLDDISQVLEKNIENTDDFAPDFIHCIALFIRVPLRLNYEEKAKNALLYSQTLASASKKKTFAEIQQTINQIYSNLCMFERGLKILDDDALKSQLVKYLLRSLCTDIVNILVIHCSTEELSSIATPEVRLKLISKLDSNIKDSLTKLNSSLTKSLDDFHEEFDNCVSKCDVMVKKLEKKRERIVLSEHRQSLIIQLNDSTDAALTLHLAILLLFQSYHNEMIHASGKFVPQLINAMRKSLPPEMFALLHNCQELVIKQLTIKEDSVEERESITNQLQEIIPKIKELAISSPKKQSVE